MAEEQKKTTVIRRAAFVFLFALALGLGLGLGLGLKKDGTTVVPTYKLASSTALTGLTVAGFSDQPRLAFRTGMAKTLDVAVGQVAITSVTASARRRNLLQSSSISVAFEVEISANYSSTGSSSAASVTAESLQQLIAVIAQKITETPVATILANLNEAFEVVAPDSGIQITAVTAPTGFQDLKEIVISDTGVVTITTVCGPDHRVSSNTCVACATGSTNKAGDDPAGADTQCDIGVSPPPPPSPPPSPPPPGIYCAANQRVVSNACVACPAGTRNSAGDAQSGADTSCTKIKCTVNQHVVSNLCVACSAGTTNVAGDDASGANTSCDAGDSSDGDSTDRDVTFG